MKKKRYPKTFLSIICLAALLNTGCIEFSKYRPPTSLNVNPANYKVKPKVHFMATFLYRYGPDLRDEDDTLKKIIEKVVKENDLFECYSIEDVNTCEADFKIEFYLITTPGNGELKPSQVIMEFLSATTFFLLPVPNEEKEYTLNTFLYDRSGKTLYNYSCVNQSSATQYSLFLPTGMIEKMVKEALFNVINNSEIIKSYRVEP